MEDTVRFLKEAEASKYITAAGLTLLLYDHILSLDDELNLIWRAKQSIPKISFLLVRYGVPCALVLQTYQLGRMPDTESANTLYVLPISWFNIAVCLGLLTTAIGNFLIMLRLWVLRDRSRKLILWTLILFVAAQIATVACAIVVLIRVNPSIVYEYKSRLCTIERRSILGTLYAPAIIFDGIALLTIFWNALDRPRTRHWCILKFLRRDGFNYILILFLMRLTSFLVTLFAPLHIVFLGFWLVPLYSPGSSNAFTDTSDGPFQLHLVNDYNYRFPTHSRSSKERASS
ncbi:hypothetical protein B0H34DRAFT_801470 [Crassisporium funariophilum]|nr:hypothetical protein B0H34DRAFT_801470 [Crassisporium funariophilum]